MTAKELSAHLKVPLTQVRSWTDKKKLIPTSKEYHRGRLRFYFNLAHAQKLKETYQHPGRVATPDGHIDANLAAPMMGCHCGTLRQKVRRGEIPGVLVAWAPGPKKSKVFVLKSFVDQFVADKLLKDASRQKESPITHFTNPIISARDYECLAARRLLLEQNGRRVIVEKVLARSRERS